MKKVSIIVPIYNVEKYLRECLDSLVYQDMPLSEYEIILVNDGSRDNSGVIAKEYASRYENVSYYEQENRGQAVARNLGMDKAQGEYVMFVDSDDYLLENALVSIYTRAKGENAEMCLATMRVMRRNGTSTIGRDFKVNNGRTITGKDALLDGIVLGSVCARLFCRDFLLANNVRFLADMKHEDVCFNLTLLPCAKRVLFVEQSIYCYRWNEESTDRSSTTESVFKSLMGDLNVACLAKELSKTYEYDYALSNYLMRLSSSLVVGNIYSLFTLNRLMDNDLKKEYLRKAKEMGLLPICRKNLSWKSSLVATLANAYMIKIE